MLAGVGTNGVIVGVGGPASVGVTVAVLVGVAVITYGVCVAAGVAVGTGVLVGNGVLVGVAVTTTTITTGVCVAVAVGVGVSVNGGIATINPVAVGVGVAVSVAVAVAVGVFVGVGVAVAVWVAVGVYVTGVAFGGNAVGDASTRAANRAPGTRVITPSATIRRRTKKPQRTTMLATTKKQGRVHHAPRPRSDYAQCISKQDYTACNHVSIHAYICFFVLQSR